jgi:hypothetical protein
MPVEALSKVAPQYLAFGGGAIALLLLLGGLLYWRGGGEPQTVRVENTPPAVTAPSTPNAAPAPPVTKVEPAVTTPEPKAVSSPTNVPAKPAPTAAPPVDSLTSRVILARQWEDCRQGSMALAIHACKALIDGRAVTGEDLAEIYYKYGRALRDNGEPDRALESYSESIRLHPTADAYTHRGVAYYDKGDDRKAVADYSEALRLDPRSAEAANNRAWTRFKSGDLTNAITDADLAVRLGSSLAYTWDTRGSINEALGKTDAAVRDFRKALALDPNSDSSRTGLTRLGATP